MTLAALGLSGRPFHEPFHVRGPHVCHLATVCNVAGAVQYFIEQPQRAHARNGDENPPIRLLHKAGTESAHPQRDNNTAVERQSAGDLIVVAVAVRREPGRSHSAGLKV
jgi:hypothetical protein